jgi:hypothetical protein
MITAERRTLADDKFPLSRRLAPLKFALPSSRKGA